MSFPFLGRSRLIGASFFFSAGLTGESYFTYYRRTFVSIRGSSNGRTAASGAAYLGSNPSPRANLHPASKAGFRLAGHFIYMSQTLNPTKLQRERSRIDRISKTWNAVIYVVCIWIDLFEWSFIHWLNK